MESTPRLKPTLQSMYMSSVICKAKIEKHSCMHSVLNTETTALLESWRDGDQKLLWWMDIRSLGENHDDCVKYVCNTSFKELCQNL